MKYLVVIVAIAVLFSCDKREDYFGINNSAPQSDLVVTNTFSYLTTDIDGNKIYDSIKVNHNYSFMLNVLDESEELYIKFEGPGTMLVNGTNLPSSDSVAVGHGTHSFVWNSSVVGLNQFKVSVSDGFGDAAVYYFNINVISNILPIFSWIVEDVGNLDSLEKRIVVTGDDGDLFYGGGILYWQYIIDSDTTNYPGKEFYYIFPSPGQYSIGVRAMDNDNQWSNTIYINNYTIQ